MLVRGTSAAQRGGDEGGDLLRLERRFLFLLRHLHVPAGDHAVAREVRSATSGADQLRTEAGAHGRMREQLTHRGDQHRMAAEVQAERGHRAAALFHSILPALEERRFGMAEAIDRLAMVSDREDARA